MAVILCNSLHSLPLSLFPTSSSPLLSLRTGATPSSKSSRARIKSLSASASAKPPMDQHDELRSKFMEFPHVSTARRELMVDLLSTMENRLGSQLLPSSLPPDAQYFENQTGTAQASLHIKPGSESSRIDFVLGSWIHCDLPTGASLNITSISAYLNSSTDAPNFVIELIQNTPTSLILILDLPHRKDLILNQDYLKIFYEDTHLDSFRQSLQQLPEVKPYDSSSLFVRCAFSPAAVMVRVDTEEEPRVEEILKDHVGPVAKEVLGLWLERCVGDEKRGIREENEKVALEKRDRCFRRRTIEVDLGSSFPRMFGEDVAARVLDAVREAFGV